MALIGSDFVYKTYDHAVRCSECGIKVPAGKPSLVSIRNGKVKKRVCSEECRLEFDAAFWAEAARVNAKRRNITGRS